ncbi:ATP-binding protein [Mesorhizobium caraganae]|uniref:ATP-binding protein n=1 Tax=Mesorhizobium caraganae TaxID=483206 RepID=UPI00333D2B7D
MVDTDDIRLSGEYFEALVTVFHNLIANAVKHSGLGRKTRVQVTCRVEPGLLSLRVENDLGEVSDDELEQMWTIANEFALKDHTKGTFREGGTGFKKIRRICLRDFGYCRINIPRPGRRKRFVVEVTLKHDSFIYRSL